MDNKDNKPTTKEKMMTHLLNDHEGFIESVLYVFNFLILFL
jgi:hypothetical protein